MNLSSPSRRSTAPASCPIKDRFVLTVGDTQINAAAPKLTDRVSVTGWLYTTAQFTAANLVRSESRRKQRETDAMKANSAVESSPDLWTAVAPDLDEAMMELSESERDAVLLRFFEKRSAQEIGVRLQQ